MQRLRQTLKTRQYKEIESIIHTSFDAFRVNPDREFFEIEPKKACEILKSFLKILGEESCLQEYDDHGVIVLTSYGKKSTSPTTTLSATTHKKGKSKSTLTAKNDTTDKHLFHAKGKKRFADASGYYDETSKSFTILKGSVITLDVTECFERGPARKEVLKVCEKLSNGYRLKEDYIFDSPSTAASVVLGSSYNGFKVWKDDDGKKLTDVYPKK